MTDDPDLDAAVQIATQAVSRGWGAMRVPTDDVIAHTVVAALARWLHDPAEVAALRAVADAARPVYQEVRGTTVVHDWQVNALGAALGALPPADVPAPTLPQGEDVGWAAHRHAGFQAAIADTDARIAEAAVPERTPAASAPAGGGGGVMDRIVTPEKQEALALALEEAALRVRQSIPAGFEWDVEDHVDRINVGVGGKDEWIPGMRSPLRRVFRIEW